MAKAKKVGNTLGAFAAAHDPQYQIHSPTEQHSRALDKSKRVFVITAAQNATPVESKFWGALQTLVKHRKAELLVVPIRFKNPTSQWSGSQQNAEWWAPEVREYLWNVRHNLGPNLRLLADIRIQPTASSPLSGTEGLTHGESGIVAHTKVQLKSVATPQGKMAKLMLTTGACTVANYSDSRAGKLGEFHHSLSAVIVELDGGGFHVRHLHFDKSTASITDLDTTYSTLTTGKALRPLALIMGDTHVDSIEPSVERALFGKGGVVETLNPQHLVYHDLLDGESVNPHTAKNPFAAVDKSHVGKDAAGEIHRAVMFVSDRGKGRVSVIVPSNHNDFLQRWLSQDWRQDPMNAECYLETALACVRAVKSGADAERFDGFGYWFNQYARGPGFKVLQRDESFILGGVELALHGDAGANGARGSAYNLRRIGVRSVIGHSHSPEIAEGCYQVGTSSKLRLGYNKGPSSWLHSHVLLYANGKRTHIHTINGKWRA